MLIAATYPIVQELFTKKASVLDFGCGSGWFLQEVGERIGDGIGVDLDQDLVAGAARRNRLPNVKYLYADARTGLPFEADQFDVIVALGVLEHVGPEQQFIQEFHRLLRPDGRLIISVPSKGPFRALDIGNIKYNFPKLHKWFYYHVARQKKYYDEKFGPGANLVGQFSKEADQHKHYSTNDLKNVASPCFIMERHVHFGLFFELIQFLEVLACKPFGRNSSRLFSWLLEQDCKLVSPFGRACIFGVFRKR